MSKKRCPANGTFELTGRCNLSCKMCLVRVDEARIRQIYQRERTTAEWIHMAEEVRDAGTLSLLLTGGEVTLRPDFCEIYEAIAQMGFLITVYTNATMVTDHLMDVFRRYPPHNIGVTMYGASNETYRRLCGCKDGYTRFTEGIRRLKELPSLFEMRTTIVQDNREDLDAMKRFTDQEFQGKKRLTISRFVTRGIRNAVGCAEKCRLTPEQNVEMIYPEVFDLQEKIRKGEIILPKDREKMKLHLHQKCDSTDLFEKCDAGTYSYTISWDGNMYACASLNDGYTRPFEQGFQDAWEKLPQQYPANHSIEVCTSCQYAGFCEACPANRLAETGDWFGIPEYACREAKYLYETLYDIGVIEQ